MADTASIDVAAHVPVLGAAGHGKSSLVERLLTDANALPAGGLEATGPGRFPLRGGTDDAAGEKNVIMLVDAPGSRALLKTIAVDGSLGDAALLVVDAEIGVDAPTRRHGYLAHLLGIRDVVVAVNGMELVGHGADRFAEVAQACRDYLEALGVTPTQVIPVSARAGDNLVLRSDTMPWYDGPTVLEALQALPASAALRALPLRIPVGDVARVDGHRVITGRVESGRLSVGDEVVFSPSNGIARVSGIAPAHGAETKTAGNAAAGEVVSFTLEDQVFVEPGEIASHTENAPVETNVFRGRMIWLGAEPLEAGRRLTLRLGAMETPATVESMERRIDTDDQSGSPADTLEAEASGEVILRARAMLALDAHHDNPRTGRFVLFDDGEAVALGVVDMEGYPDQRPLMGVKSTNVSLVEHGVSNTLRATRNGHAGGVLWFTGLSGAGKSTLAVELEKRLFTRGYQVFVLDGDNVRQGLNANLGFSPEDRAENIRRVGEVAALFADAGLIVVTAFISPYRSDRDRARQAAGERFREVHIKADIATCEERDPKGLYKRARAGEIPEFTGISAPYEAPDDPELVVDTAAHSVDEAVGALIDYVEREFELTKNQAAGD
ncbi:MAG: adenylyl-sulfate kinase [Alphaproteobacteria bacterium]|nr:adenylyl-sulfate kinase [Alphaproteobacteria bacterium]